MLLLLISILVKLFGVNIFLKALSDYWSLILRCDGMMFVNVEGVIDLEEI